ncbi:MAG: hypothetical protein HeimC3_35320 [Candidatus Heimdallarchaeota archaeon LC_3]|nr:MAG: hypothetical protein HeimC3_35320 [Candidatus Heimdallarchaeota archaeon LC_3]
MALTVIVLAITGIVSLQVGYTIQKLGVHTLFESNGQPRKQDKNFWYWVIGTLITFLASILVFFSLSEGEISVIQPLTGIGPIVLALIVTYYLKESLKLVEWAAIFISSTGVVLLSIVSAGESSKSYISENVDEIIIFIVTALIILIVSVLAIILIRAEIIKVGVVEGLAAGTIGGMPSIYAKLAIPRVLIFDFFHWSIIMLLVAQAITFYLLQRGFHVSKAAVVASLFTATSILLPVGLAQIFFDESISMLQILSMALIISGAILMSKKQEEIEHKLGDDILPFVDVIKPKTI